MYINLLIFAINMIKIIRLNILTYIFDPYIIKFKKALSKFIININYKRMGSLRRGGRQ